MKTPIPARRRLIGILSIGLVAAVLTACAGGPQTESTGQYIDSAAITAKVKASIAEAKDLSVFSIGVDTYKGVVQLSGFVSTAAQKEHAGQIARDVAGVKEVQNNILIKQ